MPQLRFAGEAMAKSGLDLIKSRSSIQENQAPGGTFESTETEKMFERRA